MKQRAAHVLIGEPVAQLASGPGGCGQPQDRIVRTG